MLPLDFVSTLDSSKSFRLLLYFMSSKSYLWTPSNNRLAIREYRDEEIDHFVQELRMKLASEVLEMEYFTFFSEENGDAWV
jgi:hypothetical protein